MKVKASFEALGLIWPQLCTGSLKYLGYSVHFNSISPIIQILVLMPMDCIQKQCLPYLGNRLRASLNIACSKKTSSRLLLLQSMSCCFGVDDVSVLKRNKHQCALLPENCYQLLEDVTVVDFDTSQIFLFITVGSCLRSSFEKEHEPPEVCWVISCLPFINC